MKGLYIPSSLEETDGGLYMVKVELSNLELGMLAKLVEYRVEDGAKARQKMLADADPEFRKVLEADSDHKWLQDFYTGLAEKLRSVT